MPKIIISDMKKRSEFSIEATVNIKYNPLTSWLSWYVPKKLKVIGEGVAWFCRETGLNISEIYNYDDRLLREIRKLLMAKHQTLDWSDE